MKICKVLFLLILHTTLKFQECEGRPCVSLPLLFPAIPAALATAAGWSGLGAAYATLATTLGGAATGLLAMVTTSSTSTLTSFVPASSTTSSLAIGGAATGLLAGTTASLTTSATSLIPTSSTTSVITLGGAATGMMATSSTTLTASGASLLPTSSTALIATLVPMVANVALTDAVVRVGQSAANTVKDQVKDPKKLKKNLQHGLKYTAENKDEIKEQIKGAHRDIQFTRTKAMTVVRLTDDTSEDWRRAKEATKNWAKTPKKKRYMKKAEAKVGEDSSSSSSSSEQIEVKETVKKAIKILRK